MSYNYYEDQNLKTEPEEYDNEGHNDSQNVDGDEYFANGMPMEVDISIAGLSNNKTRYSDCPKIGHPKSGRIPIRRNVLSVIRSLV